MKPELSGFYYDEEKNKYFPIKGPIPGKCSSSRTKRKTYPNPEQEPNCQKITKGKALKLLHSRELNGNVIPLHRKMSNFKEEIQKTQASFPVVWRYGSTENIGGAALKQMQVDIQTSVGLTRKNVLVGVGQFLGNSSCLSVLRISKHRQVFDGAIECVPVSVFPPTENDSEEREAPWITAIGPNVHGSIFVLNIADERSILTQLKLQGSVSSECTIWTTACNLSGSHAAIGTNLGAALVDLETRSGSYFLLSKSDVFAMQFHQSGNIVHCGLRNGAIVTVDLRERPGRPFPRLTRHQIRYQPSSKTVKTNKHWFELKGNINPSHIIYMASSLTCLKTLRTSDQYLMASSVDGTMRLYDQRMVKRGICVQTYEGHLNSRTRIQFGIDPTERFLLSGGEDCYTRIWNIKSGQLMSENKFSDSVPSVVCWSADESKRDRRDRIIHGAWLGSREAIFHVS